MSALTLFDVKVIIEQNGVDARQCTVTFTYGVLEQEMRVGEADRVWEMAYWDVWQPWMSQERSARGAFDNIFDPL